MTHIKALVLLALLMIMTVSLCAATREYIGYLSDNDCGIAGKDDSGAELTDTPWKHTSDCMKSHRSGYGMLISNPAKKFSFYKFDQKGSVLAKKTILDKTKLKTNIMVRTRGTIDERVKMMNVESISQYFPPMEIERAVIIPKPSTKK